MEKPSQNVCQLLTMSKIVIITQKLLSLVHTNAWIVKLDSSWPLYIHYQEEFNQDAWIKSLSICRTVDYLFKLLEITIVSIHIALHLQLKWKSDQKPSRLPVRPSLYSLLQENVRFMKDLLKQILNSSVQFVKMETLNFPIVQQLSD